MKNLFSKFASILALAMMLGLSASIIQLTDVAFAANCEGLSCDDGADCGSKCFCNNPGNQPAGGECILDSAGGGGGVKPTQ